MASRQTANFGLNQWDAEDSVLREEFNADNAKTDAALAKKADSDALAALEADLAGRLRVIVGTYTGDGAANQMISLGVTPKAVFTIQSNGYLSQQYQSYYFGGLALEGAPVKGEDALVVKIVTGGFRVYFDSSKDIEANYSGTVYHYMALI